MTPFSPGLNQQVAPLNPTENAGLNLTGQAAGPQSALNYAAAPNYGNFVTGANLTPQSNPNLQNYFQAAATPVVQNYLQSIAPSRMAEFQRAGSFGGSSMAETQGQDALALGTTLGNLSANIYSPAYQQGQQLQMQALQGLPAFNQGLTIPGQTLFQSGLIPQQQQQQELNVGYQNQLAQTQFPFQLLGQLGQMISAGTGGGGTTISSYPGQSSGGK